jgi:hypothetical protein
MTSKDLENNLNFLNFISLAPSFLYPDPYTICPEVALSNCNMAFPNVDLPQPSPTKLVFLPHTL